MLIVAIFLCTSDKMRLSRFSGGMTNENELKTLQQLAKTTVQGQVRKRLREDLKALYEIDKAYA